MATESAFIWDKDFTANSDLSANQFYGVKLVGDNKVDLITDEQDSCVGILQNKPKAGEAATVRMLGESKCIVDGSGTAIAAGDPLGVNDSGVFVKKATNDYTMVGTTPYAATAANVVSSLMVPPFGHFYYRTPADA